MKNMVLKTPNREDLKYRKKWMNDPKTMAYNAGLDLDIKGYDKATGTISKTDEELNEWYDEWIGHEPDRYYAYIYVEDIEDPIGEIYYYPDGDIHSMGIVIDDKYRGKGYSYDALLELEKIAFIKNKISELSDMVPLDRIGAIKTFKKAGFVHTDKEVIEKVFNKDSIVRELLITKKMYLDKLIIRNATINDIPEVAQLHVDSWNKTYKGIIAQDHLDNMKNNMNKRITRMEEEFDLRKMIVATIDNEIVAFSEYTLTNEFSKDLDIDCELCGLYVKNQYEGTGIGSKMFNYVMNEFIKNNNKMMGLWCVKENTNAINFYKSKGGKQEAEKRFELAGKEYSEIAFVYDLTK